MPKLKPSKSSSLSLCRVYRDAVTFCLSFLCIYVVYISFLSYTLIYPIGILTNNIFISSTTIALTCVRVRYPWACACALCVCAHAWVTCARYTCVRWMVTITTGIAVLADLSYSADTLSSPLASLTAEYIITNISLVSTPLLGLIVKV